MGAHSFTPEEEDQEEFRANVEWCFVEVRIQGVAECQRDILGSQPLEPGVNSYSNPLRWLKPQVPAGRIRERDWNSLKIFPVLTIVCHEFHKPCRGSAPHLIQVQAFDSNFDSNRGE